MTQASQALVIDVGPGGSSFSFGPKVGYDTHLDPKYLEKYKIGNIFIETGTYLGETVRMVRDSKLFDSIYSIELNDELYRHNVKTFEKDENVHIFLGESPDKIREIIGLYKDQPMTFWLDAHASGPVSGGKYGGSPLVEEIEAIFQTSNVKNHTIFIDDRRLFMSPEWDYLSEERVMELLKQSNPDFKFEYFDGEIPQDVIVAYVEKT
jgi:hypothetical protein